MWRRSAGFGLFAALIATASIIACRQLVGITDNPPEDLVTSICGLPYGTNTCASCVNANCCAESNACAADPVCSAYESCLGACNGDSKCRSECTTYPVSNASDVSALSSCLASECETACNLTCGAIAAYISEPDAAVGCQSCIEHAPGVCAHAQACGSSADCDAFWRCYLAGPPTTDSLSTCGYDHEAGFSLSAPLYRDYAGACALDCAYGGYWACVGQVNWLLPTSPTVTQTNVVVDPESAPIVGAEVSVCPECPCGENSGITPLRQGPTLDGGAFTLTFPNTTVDQGGFGLNGCVQITAANYLPAFAYWSSPLSEAKDSIDFSLDRQTYELGLTTTTEWQALLQALQIPQEDPNLGFITAHVLDCLGAPASGMQLALSTNVDAGSSGAAVVVPYFRVAGSSEGASTMAKETDATGEGGFFNVPPGPVELTAAPAGGGRPTSIVQATVQAGTITEVLMPPTPLIR